MPGVASAQTINSKVVRYLAANVGRRVGGGENTNSVTEALRSAGAAFIQNDLGSDYPDQGDRMWGTPIKVISNVRGSVVDSNPKDDVLPGDVLQYKGTKFVTVTDNGRKTTTTTISSRTHTSVVARVNSKTKQPTMVYEQNAPAAPNVDARKLYLNSIDFSKMTTGMVFVYRPKIRVDDPMKYQISIVNNTSATKVPTLKSGLTTVARMSLDPFNTQTSYTEVSANSKTAKTGLSLVLPNGESIAVQNAASYEIYKRTNGVIAIRRVEP